MAKSKKEEAFEYFTNQEERESAMETYESLFNEAEAVGKAKEYSFDIIKWEKEGQSVIGEIQGFEDFTEGEFETACNKWLIKTDHGAVSCVLGSAADKRLKDALTGDLIKIIYHGKLELSDGRRVNRFELKVVHMD